MMISFLQSDIRSFRTCLARIPDVYLSLSLLPLSQRNASFYTFVNVR